MILYVAAITWEYPVIFPKWDSLISRYVSFLRYEFNSRWERVFLLLQKKGHMCLLMKSYQKRFDRAKQRNLHLVRKYTHRFVLGHYLFLVAHSSPRVSFSEYCSPLRTVDFLAYFLAGRRLLFIFYWIWWSLTKLKCKRNRSWAKVTFTHRLSHILGS